MGGNDLHWVDVTSEEEKTKVEPKCTAKYVLFLHKLQKRTIFSLQNSLKSVF